jgi:hypothetical protein
MMHDRLKTIIERYTPTMLDRVVPGPPDQIDRLAQLAGPLPESYREFLGWMGNRCPFLDGAELSYSPKDLLRVYEDPEDETPDGFILIGIDDSGNSCDVHIRRHDGAILRLSLYYDGVTNEDSWLENASFSSFLVTTYVQKTLVPSHPFCFAASFNGDEQIEAMWRRVAEACGHFEIPYSIEFPDFRFYGGIDFVIGVHRRSQSSPLTLHFGAIERSGYEPWYDLIFDRWRWLRAPL